MQYEVHESVLLIKGENGTEFSIDAEFLSRDEIDKMLDKLLQYQIPEEEEDDADPIPIFSLSFPVYDTISGDGRDLNAFLQVDYERRYIIILFQVDHPLFSTSFLQKFPFNNDTKSTLINMLNEVRDVSYDGSIVELATHFAMADDGIEYGSSSDSDSDSESDSDLIPDTE